MSDQSPVLDLKRLGLLRAGSGDEVDPEFTQLVRAFLESARATAPELRDAQRVGDRPQIGALAHRLKGSSGLFGALRLRDTCGALEAAARLLEPPERVDAALGAVEREIAEACRAIEREVEGLAGPEGTGPAQSA